MTATPIHRLMYLLWRQGCLLKGINASTVGF